MCTTASIAYLISSVELKECVANHNLEALQAVSLDCQCYWGLAVLIEVYKVCVVTLKIH